MTTPPGGCSINVKPLLLGLRWHGRFTTLFMVQRRLARTNVPRLGPCLAALRALAKSNDPRRSSLVESPSTNICGPIRLVWPTHLSDFEELSTTKRKDAMAGIGAWEGVRSLIAA